MKCIICERRNATVEIKNRNEKYYICKTCENNFYTHSNKIVRIKDSDLHFMYSFRFQKLIAVRTTSIKKLLWLFDPPYRKVWYIQNGKAKPLFIPLRYNLDL